MESDVDFVGLDVPGVNGRLLHVMPSVAEARWAKTLPAWFAKHPVRKGESRMKLSRQQALATIGGSLAVVPSTVRAQAAPATIRMAAPPAEQEVPLYYAMRTGLFERAGIKIEMAKMGSGAAVAAA